MHAECELWYHHYVILHNLYVRIFFRRSDVTDFTFTEILCCKVAQRSIYVCLTFLLICVNVVPRSRSQGSWANVNFWDYIFSQNSQPYSINISLYTPAQIGVYNKSFVYFKFSQGQMSRSRWPTPTDFFKKSYLGNPFAWSNEQ